MQHFNQKVLIEKEAASKAIENIAIENMYSTAQWKELLKAIRNVKPVEDVIPISWLEEAFPINTYGSDEYMNQVKVAHEIIDIWRRYVERAEEVERSYYDR